MASAQTAVVLNSWKEIASYVGRGVRTVQRWENDLGLPVRRPRARSRSAVVAMSDEIDVWLRSAPKTEVAPHHRSIPELEALRRSLETHIELRDRCNHLRQQHAETMANFILSLRTLTESVQNNKQA